MEELRFSDHEEDWSSLMPIFYDAPERGVLGNATGAERPFF